MNFQEKALQKVKIELMSMQPFLAHIGLQVPHTFNKDIPTACTYYSRVEYNPDLFMSLTHPMRVFVMAHELWHIALMHNIRCGDRNPVIWNKAADYVINWLLLLAGFTLPDWVLCDKRFAGMSTEQVYSILMSEGESDNDEDFKDLLDIVFGEGDGDPGSAKPTQDQIEKVKQIVHRATITAKMSGLKPGSIPGEVDRILDNLINPVLPWNIIVGKYLTAMTSGGVTWTRPNRRYSPKLYLPALKSRTLGKVVFAIDLSCSVTEEQQREMLTEIDSVRRRYRPEQLTLLDCDDGIHNIHIVKPNQHILSLTLTGGGGTSYKPVEAYCDEHKPDLLIYFTDLEISEEDDIIESKPYNILWINHGNNDYTGSVGSTVRYRQKSGTKR